MLESGLDQGTQAELKVLMSTPNLQSPSQPSASSLAAVSSASFTYTTGTAANLMLSLPQSTSTSSVSSNTSPPSVSLAEVRKKTTSGTVKPLPHEQWTSEMKQTISQLLASCHAKKDKFATVERQYLDLLYKDCQNPSSHLRYTSKRFIQLYERHLHRKIEENTAINTTTEQTSLVQDIAESLVNPGTVPTQLVTPSTSQVHETPPPSQKRTIDATLLGEQLLKAIIQRTKEKPPEGTSSSQPAPKRKCVSTVLIPTVEQ